MLKRPKLSKREDASSAPAPASSSGGAPPPLPKSSGTGISTAALQAALGGSYTSPTGGGGGGSAASGITKSDLGWALTGGGGGGGNRSVHSTRHTSYPQSGDLNGLPARAGTRTGPRTTSYRIPLQRGAQMNVYDTIN